MFLKQRNSTTNGFLQSECILESQTGIGSTVSDCVSVSAA
jgi:hypothetical protein